MIELANRKLIEEARKHLRRASHFLRMAESGNKPFRVGKAINMMGKTTYDDSMILSILLGELDYNDADFEMITHAVKLIQAEVKDNPDLFRGKPS